MFNQRYLFGKSFFNAVLGLGAFIIFNTQTSAAASGWSCDESKVIEHTFPRADIELVTINALAGELEVIGEDSDSVVVYAKVCVDREEYLDEMTIDIIQSSEQLNLTAIIPYNKNGWRADYAYMDITLTLPRDLAIELRDSSGDIRVSGAALRQVDDSSGDIHIEDTNGPLNILDSSGEIDVRGLDGDIEITDSSGHIELRNISGNVNIPRDSSGDIELEIIEGRIDILRDSSGEIDIDTASQSVSIGSDGSGGIRISNIEGSVFIGSDGSGNVNISHVGGNFSLESKGNGNIRTRDISGEISIPR
ncbi:MAG: hypothetical protein ACI9FB_001434 [Candidatus Azotimanducaceae bacterium]|jgi:hypothetical protein